MARMSRSVDAVLIGLAILSRVAAVWLLQSHLVPRSTYEHGEIAANILAGRGFSIRFLGSDGPTSQQAPVYPAIVALAYAMGGVETPRSLLYLQIGQAILGGLLVLGVLRLCRLIAPAQPLMRMDRRARRRASSHVGLRSHAYPGRHAGNDVPGLDPGVGLPDRVDPRDSRRRHHGRAARNLDAHGPDSGTFAPGSGDGHRAGRRRPARAGSPITHVDRGRGADRRRRHHSLAGAQLRDPWRIRGREEHVRVRVLAGQLRTQRGHRQGRPALGRADSRTRSTGAGLTELNRKLWEARHEAGYLDDIALTSADYRVLGSVSEPERSRILFNRALADLRANPARYLTLCVRRLRYFIFFDETNPKSRILAYRLPHLALTIFATIGLWLAPVSIRKRLRPTMAMVAAIALFHALTIVSARFHIPVEPFLAIWGAAGVTRGQRACVGTPGPVQGRVAGSRVASRRPAAWNASPSR